MQFGPSWLFIFLVHCVAPEEALSHTLPTSLHDMTWLLTINMTPTAWFLRCRTTNILKWLKLWYRMEGHSFSSMFSVGSGDVGCLLCHMTCPEVTWAFFFFLTIASSWSFSPILIVYYYYCLLQTFNILYIIQMYFSLFLPNRLYLYRLNLLNIIYK